MVYKKYIKRDGKVFGPYYCESYRENGKIKTRFVSGPKKKDFILKNIKKLKDLKKINKKTMMLSLIFLSVFFLLLVGNINYNISGKAISENSKILKSSLNDVAVAEKIEKDEINTPKEIDKDVNLEIKDKSFVDILLFKKKNKKNVFDTPEGKIDISFNLLDYNEFEETNKEEVVRANDFDINVNQTKEKYKWGYKIKLNDLNFMAKINVKADEDVIIIDEKTLKIGNNYISFNDLVEQGYILSLEEPVILNELYNIDEKNLTEKILIALNNVTKQQFNIRDYNEEEIFKVLWCYGSDINYDGKVNDLDFELFKENYGRDNCDNENEWCNNTDSDKDGKVSNWDWFLLRKNVNRNDCFPNEQNITLDEDMDYKGYFNLEDNENVSIILEKLKDTWCQGADINKDGIVNDTDWSFLNKNFKKICFKINNWCNNSDINKDGIVNNFDLYILKNNYNRINCNPNYIPDEEFNESISINKTKTKTRIRDYTCDDADFDNNGYVDFKDYRIIRAFYLELISCSSENNWCNKSDINKDGKVTSFDWSVFYDKLNTLRCGKNYEDNNNNNKNNNKNNNNNNYYDSNDYDSNGYVTGSSVKKFTGFFIKSMKGITGFFIHGWRGLTGFAIQQDNSVSIYVYKNFENTPYQVGDIINLDPVLIRILSSGTAVDGDIVFQCGTINQSGTYYLNQSITNLEGTCLTIQANDVEVDLNNSEITGGGSSMDYGFGILISNSNNIIKNGLINNFYAGIRLENSNNNITNMNIENSGNGISLVFSQNNNFNKLNLNNNLYGINFFLESNNNNITNAILDNNNEGIYLEYCSNNLFIDINISDSNLNDTRLLDLSLNNIFVNVSYENEYLVSDSSLTRKWYYRGHVIDNSYNNIENANVLGYNVSNDLNFNLTTDSSGLTPIYEIIDYINNGTRNYYSNYSIFAKYQGNITEISYNVTLNKNNLNNIINIDVGQILNGTAVDANGNVYRCGTLTSEGNYNLNQSIVNLTSNCLIIESNNVLLNGNGFELIGNGNYGILTNENSNLINITIKNFANITNFTKGIYLDKVNNSLIENNTINIPGNLFDTYSFYGIYLKDSALNDIKNNKIYFNGVSSNYDTHYGIYLNVEDYGENNISENDMNLYSDEGANYGIYFAITGLSNSNIIQNNNFNMNSYYNYPIYFYIYNSGESNYNEFKNNNINISSDSYYGHGYGIYIYNSGESNYNIFHNETINTNSFDSRGIYLSNIDYSNISRININANIRGDQSNAYDLYFSRDSSHNVIKDSKLNGNSYNVYSFSYNQGGGINNTLINVSYGNNREYANSGSQLIRKWYYRAYVEDNQSTSVSGASVLAYNISGDLTLNLTTNSSGWTPIGEISDYVNNGGIKIYQSFYILVANNDALWDSHNYNVTNEHNNLNDSFTIEEDYTSPIQSTSAWTASTTSATIIWNTDEGSNSSVTYWASPSTTIGDNKYVLSHSVELTGLSSNTSYSYYYTSCDFAGNCNSSSTYGFKTSASEGVLSRGGSSYCVPNFECEWSDCINGVEKEINCIDINDCESKGFIVSYTPKTRNCGYENIANEIPISSKSCIPNWECSKWSECKVTYDLEDITEKKVLLKGEQTRICEDISNCLTDKIERQECSTKLPIIAKKTGRCFKNYIEIYDNSDLLISRMEINSSKLNIQMIFDKIGYCPYCYNGVKDYDEDFIDCVYEENGNCPVCFEQISSYKFDYRFFILIFFFILFILTLWYFYLNKRIKKRNTKIRKLSRR